MSKKVKIFFICGVTISILAYFTVSQIYKYNTSDGSPQGINPKIESYDPAFTKEGELNIIDTSNNKVIKRISIEIADREKDIMQGLMYRSQMIDTLGMLFVFRRPMVHSFWMKNTRIPLDIIFIDENFRIATIQRNTTPYSEKPIPSEAEVLYVLEVNAGFCDRHGVRVGNLINYSLNSI